MNTDAFKERLLARQQELLDSISRSDTDARESRSAEVEDSIDQVTSDELKATAFAVSTVEARTLEQVRAALQRLQDGSYGKCIDCGRSIELARLEAIPWTPYCRADQEKHDAETARPEF
ncbi:MAG TPA: TraR/DksA family transcriptional regulator [Bryobacteraceae bacterium]|jgi:DnaK suppressor protein|nr:TraR/DksA family transcriptional regulator [Bryobacteraceae bacterium]